MPVNTWTVLILGLLTALATGLGAVPFFFRRRIGGHVTGTANAAAAGLMLAATLTLLIEGVAEGPWRTVLGMAIGGIAIWQVRQWTRRHNQLHVRGFNHIESGRILLIMIVMTAHSFSEGIGVGVSLAGGRELGFYVTAAIALHNIPEGLAISLVLVPRGMSVWRAAFWSVFSSLPQPLLAVPAYLLVDTFRPYLPVGLGFAAGAMLWMVLFELIPEAREGASRLTVAVTVALGVAAMMGVTLLLPASP